ncbi:hypothetical protein Tco_0258015, partial [Tanacetum coccineum]
SLVSRILIPVVYSYLLVHSKGVSSRESLHQTMAPVHISSGPEPMSMTPGQFSSGLIPNQVHATNYVLPTYKDLELLFQPMFDEYFEVTRGDEPVPSTTVVNAQVVPLGTTVADTPITQATLHPSVNPK